MDGELAEFKHAVRAFVAKEVVPLVAAGEPAPEAIEELAAHLSSLGYLDAAAPESAGGLGTAAGCAAVEALAAGWGSLAWSVLPYLTALSAGLAEVGEPPLGWGLSCPDPDAWATSTPALSINAPTCERILVIPPPGADAAVSVVTSSIGPKARLALEGFAEAEVGTASLIGGVAVAGAACHRATVVSRVLSAAVAVGLSRGAMACAAQYTAQRRQFGAPIATFGEIRGILTQAAARVEAAHRAVSAVALDHGLTAVQAAQTLLVTVDLAVEVGDRCQHTHGGYGHLTEFPIGRFVRDLHTLAAWATPRGAFDEKIAAAIGLPAAQ